MTNAQVARALRMAALVAASLDFAHAASAQQPSQEQVAVIRAVCPADYGAHCVGITPGGQRALACLRQHLAELSAPCQQAVNAAIAGTPPAPAAQAPAVPPPAAAQSQAPAATAPPPPPAAPPPAAERPARPVSPRDALRLIRGTCGADFRAYCRGAGIGGGRAIGCLRENAANLSPRCREALMALGRP
jgi:hypothetical protein